MADWAAIQTQIVNILRGVTGFSTSTVEAYLPATIHATPFCVVTRVSDDRRHEAGMQADIYRVRLRVLNAVTDEKGAEAQLDTLRPLILAAFDARRTLNGTVSIALLDLIEYDPFVVASRSGTNYLYCDFYLTAKALSAAPVQL